MSDTTPPLTLRPKVKVTRLNKLALVLAGSAAFLAGGALLYSSQQSTPTPEAPPKQTAIPAKSNEQAWYSSIPDGLPSTVQAKPEPIPEPETPPRVELPKDPQPPTIVPKEQTEAEQRMQQDLAAALRADTTVNAFTNSPERSGSQPHPQPEHQAHQAAPEYGMEPQARGDHQDAKRQWLKEVSQNDKSDYLPSMLKKPISPYVVQAGSVIPAVMVMGINSDLPGQLVARVRETVYSSVNENIPLIPQGATLVGLYDSSVAYGQERLLQVWNRMIFPNGSSMNLMGQPGADMAGMSGFHDKVNNHYLRLFGGAILMSMISAGAQLSQPQESADKHGAPSVTQILAASLGQSLGQVSAEMIQRNMNIAPTLEVRPGYPFNIVLVQDLVLPGPYNH